MALRPIITTTDSLLRQTSLPVERVDAEIGRLIDDLLETMYAAPGIGLAAIQVAVPRRLLVADVAGEDEAPAPLALINPEILWLSDEYAVHNEGCLSIPEHYAEVERPARCRVRYTDRHGKRLEIEADGLLSTCLQHEIDHLDGTLFVDYLSHLKRRMIIRKVAKAEREAMVL